MGKSFLCVSARNQHGTHITLADRIPTFISKNLFKLVEKLLYSVESVRNWHGTHITLAKHVPWHHTAKNRFKPFPKRVYTGIVLRIAVL